jgi:hypothetical protein
MDHEYYSKLATECDEILGQIPSTLADGRKIPPDAVKEIMIRHLHPEYIRVTHDRVLVAIGVGRGGYNISWKRFPGAIPGGELRVDSESGGRSLYMRGILGPS